MQFFIFILILTSKIFIYLFTDIENFNVTDKTNTVQKLQVEIQEKDAIIEQLQFQISEMQKHYQDWIENVDKKYNDKESEENLNEPNKTHVANIPICEDQSYFASYAHFHIHHEMLSVSNICNHIKNLLYWN